tara:strand:- start:63 stop:200 length:138 start_codon:yes stop_codon:yes gene_type:complete
MLKMETPVYNAKFAADTIKLIAKQPLTFISKQPQVVRWGPKTFMI